MPELLLSEEKGVKTYLVENSKWGKNSLCKVLDNPYPTERQVRDFFHEFDLLSELDTPGIRKPIGKEDKEEKLATYYEYFEGFTLKKLIQTGKNDLNLTLKTGLFLCETLSNLHGNNVLHKSVSNHNILFNPSQDQFCLIDFANASTIRQKKLLLGNPENLHGDLSYISPEQTGRMNRVIDNRSDLYSLGIVLYELATGVLPFPENDPYEIIYDHIAVIPKNPDKINAEIPESLSRIIMKLLEKDADKRYQSASGLRNDLQILQKQLLSGKIEDFEIAEKDRAQALSISQKLYGREKQIKYLQNSFQKVASGGFEVNMVSGYSGTGKSSLVHEVYNSISKSRGYFLSGKYDQLQRNIPYYAIRQALREYVFYLLTEDEEVTKQLRDTILDKLGPDVGLVTELVPELELIVGKQPKTGPQSGIEAQNRFNYTFNQFLKSITFNGNPIVFFIDDLQWADLASLNLISNILEDDSIHHLLFIGAFRDNEVSEGHPLQMMIKNSEQEGVKIGHLEVANLSQENVLQLIADTLYLPLDKVNSLAHSVYNHTDGNAFYTTQLLQSLSENGLIYFDDQKNEWNWEKDIDAKMTLTENVIDLMASKVSKLDTTTIDLLKKGSCIGNIFSRDDLKVISEIDEKDFDKSLIKAQEVGLIYEDNDNFRFIHDRIQQAVYSLISSEEKERVHLEIGLSFLEKYSNESTQLFDLVDQINAGKSLISGNDNKIKYANLNLQAGKQAKESTAYDSSLKYFQTGLELADDDWNNQYELILNLHTNAAESTYLLGLYQEMQEHIHVVEKNGKDLLDKIPVYKTNIEALKSQNRLAEAVTKGLEVLKMLSIPLPYQPSKFQVMQKLGSTKIKLLGKNVEDFASLEKMKDPYKLASMQILVSIGPAIYYSSPNLIPLTVFEMVLLSVKYGNTDESVFAYSTYGLILCGVTNEIKLGDRYGFLALKLSETANPVNQVKGIFNVYCFVNHWSHPLSDSFVPFRNAFQLGLEAGDLEFSALSGYLYCNHSFYAGTKLDLLNKDFELFSNEIKRIKQYTPLYYNNLHWQTALNLQTETDHPTELRGPVYDETEMFKTHQKAKDKTALFKYHLLKMMLNYLFGDFEIALEHGNKGEEYLQAVTGMYVTPSYFFYLGLVLCAKYNEDPKSENKSTIKRIRSIITRFSKWAANSPENNNHKYYLLQAEFARINKNERTARVKYDDAIEAATEHQFLNDTSLAYELAGKYYLSIDHLNLAKFYLDNALSTYEKWGAKTKYRDLKYSLQLDEDPAIQTPVSVQKSAMIDIDLNSVIKANNAISEEIEFDQLKVKLLKILTENAGAEKAGFFLVNQGIPVLEQIWPINPENLEFPKSMINLAIRSQELIFSDNASQDKKFSDDPYVMENELKSALCLPVIYQSELLAIIYLENNLVYNAFSHDRIELLKLLSGQIATSIRNATLYKNLNNSYEEQVMLKNAYSKFVPMDFLEFLGTDSILDMKLGDQIEKDVTVMFIDIVEYTTLSESMSPADNFNFINGALRRLLPIISEFGGFISQFLGDGVMAIFAGRAESALNSAIQIQEEIRIYNNERNKKGRIPIQVGIGLNYGAVMLGVIGDNKRMDQNVISDNVNVASRVQDLTRYYQTGVLLTDELKKAIEAGNKFHLRYLGNTTVKGRKDTVSIYECLDGLSVNEKELKISSIKEFDKGVNRFYKGDFSGAIKLFEKVLKENPEDLASQRFLNRSTELLNSKTPEGWPGTEIIYRKST